MKKIVTIIFVLGIIIYISGTLYENIKHKEICRLQYCKSGVDCGFSPQYEKCLDDKSIIID